LRALASARSSRPHGARFNFKNLTTIASLVVGERAAPVGRAARPTKGT
jgi:hypothetical protein